MLSLYDFLTGPMLWISFIILIGGLLFNLVGMFVSIHKKERHIYSYMSLKYSLRSIFMWSVPFATTNMRLRPVMTVVAFAFHICLMAAPALIISHGALWEESWNLTWTAVITEGAGDVMTLIVIASCLFFLGRRLFLPEVKFLTSPSDFFILAMVAAPFVTGFFAFHQLGPYRLFMIAHVLSGEILLMAIPFTRLSHMISGPFVRAHTGSEFGMVRKARDW
ncbi:Nitrate reductase [Candidatus Desulfarcum epimagneticum]|uniref:Nitrate reductase n=1 Tax=uncultured Desulfobacteraceae bacterium TaxID=218296 RepID=A0A484HII3_9BACT|nr:Nitrate reductase [uncultured Desulfobacteraceae bacterium]